MNSLHAANKIVELILEIPQVREEDRRQVQSMAQDTEIDTQTASIHFSTQSLEIPYRYGKI